MNGNNSFILIMKGVKCHQIILQLEFHFSGEIKKNSEEFAQLCRVIYDDGNF
jgi:hypothetical protein